MRDSRGFTLVELLVTISIISVLASVVLTSVNSARNKAKYAAAKTEINQFMKLIDVARGESGKTFGEITGNLCSECACRGRGPAYSIPKDDACWGNYQAALNFLNTAAGGAIVFNQAIADPWGSPYLFNENEGEGGCYTDNIASPGPNGLWYDSDDVNVNLPVIKCSPVIGPHHANMNW
ncbi:MAG: Uncharacterized protein G01um101433_486 [Parcubacteria group bacterium Gr01-1014_33]|nr:MAG: Uncharacterized protein G01um101433_486 [Parcubacteria group bacterium Gr01-1014_33]